MPSYRRLVLAADRVVGAAVLGRHPVDPAAATTAAKQGLVLDAAARAAAQAGDWSVLAKQPQAPNALPAAV